MIHVQNSGGDLFNKTIQQLHVYAHSEITDLGSYHDLPQDFHLLIDSARLEDGEHTLCFEIIDVSGQTFYFNFTIFVDNTAPMIEDLTLFGEEVMQESFFSESTSMGIELSDISDIKDVRIHVLKVLKELFLKEVF